MKSTETTTEIVTEATTSLYEVAFMVKEESGFDRVKAILSQHQATVVAEQPITKAKLAYPINKIAFAFFGIIRFNALPETITSITHDFSIEDGFLRHMIHAVRKVRHSKRRTEESVQSERQPFVRDAHRTSPEAILTNEDLEKKIEEISQTEA